MIMNKSRLGLNLLREMSGSDLRNSSGTPPEPLWNPSGTPLYNCFLCKSVIFQVM